MLRRHAADAFRCRHALRRYPMPFSLIFFAAIIAAATLFSLLIFIFDVFFIFMPLRHATDYAFIIIAAIIIFFARHYDYYFFDTPRHYFLILLLFLVTLSRLATPLTLDYYDAIVFMLSLFDAPLR